MNARSSLEDARAPVAAVAIGASAGGIEALMTILPALPAGFSAPVFVAIHLPRQRPSLLVELFSRQCRVAVHEPVDKEPVVAGHIYFAPPDYHMLLDRRREIALSVDEPVNFSRPSIDVMFESLADVYGEGLLGIVLSGANDDGARGLAAIAAAGGSAVVQSPDSAQSRAMPEAALKLSPQARVLSPPQIAQWLPTATLAP